MRKTEKLPVSCGQVTLVTRTVRYIHTVSSRFIWSHLLALHTKCNPFETPKTKQARASSGGHRERYILYIDNVLSSFVNEFDLLTYFTESRSLMSSASMNLRSWTSNSEALRTHAAWDGVLDSDVIVKILGMRWDPITDEMSFAERNIPILDVVTKRTC